MNGRGQSASVNLMYSPRLDLALTMVLDAHGLKPRKTGHGYEATHVLAVALIVADFDFPEDAVIAAMLHDTLEDTTLDRGLIRSTFGDHILAIVDDVSEPSKTLPWRERKLAYIDQLRRSPRDEARAVASADKIHNLSKLTEGIQSYGAAYLSRFNAPVDQLVWYQRTVLATLRDTWQHRILDEQARRLDAFVAATGH